METDLFYREFGKLIRGHRERLGITQDELGERVGLSRTSITNIEQGRQRVLFHHVCVLAESLGIGPELLLPNTRVSEPLAHIEKKLPKDLTTPEREWVRRVVASSSREGGRSHADSKD
ncbi:MAG: helix-turn-helix domain-containing protein [Nitrososphaerales archaeon]